MFEDSMIESGGRLKTKRGRTTTFSFFVEAILVGIMVLVPLLFSEGLPKAQLMMALFAPAPPPPPPAAVHLVKQVETAIVSGKLRTPSKIPTKVEIIKEEEQALPPTAGVVAGVLGGAQDGRMNPVMVSIIGNTPMAVPKVAVGRIRVSQGVTQGMVLDKVQPTYPPLARTARVQGSVVLAAVIGKDGTIQNLHVISGPPLLIQAALDAVRQWRYRPYILNDVPVEVDTQVTVNFTLSGQ